MEEKKSHKADLEHRRPYVFAASLVGVTLFFVALLFIPFKSISQMLEDSFDDYSMDLDLKAQDQDDMISAAQPEPQKPEEQKQSENLNPVDAPTELAPEQIQQAVEEKEEEKNDSTEDVVEPINQNGDDPEALKIVEELPEYPGGMVEFMKWLTATLRYPVPALRQHIQGKVMVSFIVNTDGTVSNIKLTKPVNKLLDNEALRVLRLMPKWKPGLENGKPCRTMVAIPVVFEI